jgi:hypothetical protein
MVLRELLFGSDDRNEIDHYRVSHQQNGSGWQPLDGYDKLDEPITKQTFEYNEESLDPGQYKLFAVKDHLHTQMPDGVGWKLTVEDDTANEASPKEEQIRELEEIVEQYKQDQQSTDDTEQLIERTKQTMALQLLQNPIFLQEHGDRIALSMLGADSTIGTDIEADPPEYDLNLEEINELAQSAAGGIDDNAETLDDIPEL